MQEVEFNWWCYWWFWCTAFPPIVPWQMSGYYPGTGWSGQYPDICHRTTIGLGGLPFSQFFSFARKDAICVVLQLHYVLGAERDKTDELLIRFRIRFHLQ